MTSDCFNIQKILHKINFLLFHNRRIFCCVPVLVGWFCAWHYHAMYQTMDDWDMRIILDGTAGGYTSAPTEFCLYMNILYGKFLKLFYTMYQPGCWYDVFTYLFCSISVYVITIAVCKNFNDKSLFYKLIILVVNSFVCATAFVSPQFTITSGMLAISGVLAFFMFVTNYFEDMKYQIYCIIYCFISLIFSSLIRFEACMIVSFFMGIILLPFWPFRQWKELLKKSFVIVLTLGCIIGAFLVDSYLVGLNPEWSEARQFNRARVEIADKTNMWDNLSSPWIDIEDKLIQSEDYEFTKGDYRLLLTTFSFSKNNIFSSENITKVADTIGDNVQESNNIGAGFRIKDYRNTFFSFLCIIILISILYYGSLRYAIFACMAFFILVVTLNCEFRALPYRLWYNFILIVILGIMISVNSYTVFVNNFIIRILAFAGIFYFSFNTMYSQALSTEYQYSILRQYRSEIGLLPKNKLYILDFANYEHMTRPFARNVLPDSIVMSPLNFEQQYRNLLDKYHIDEQYPWDNICSKESQTLILYNHNVYNQPVRALKKAISYYMLEKYGKHVVFIGKYQTPNLVTYQCRALDDQELKAKEQYNYEMKRIAASTTIQELLKIDLAKRTLGVNADYSALVDLITILGAESIIED